jgi:putative transposase
MSEDRPTKVALFRFGVIAPLVCAQLEPAEGRELKRAIGERAFTWPDGKMKRVARRTLSHWCWRYRNRGGFAGLVDGKRKDAGRCRAIPHAVLLRAEELRQELPSRSVRQIISLLEQEGFKQATELAEATLNRQLKQKGLTRERLKQGAGDYQRFEKEIANAMWQSDTAHGIWLPDPGDPRKVKRTKLIIFVDDCSRLIPHAQFYFDEQLPSLVDCFRKSLLKRGKPRKLLFDNAFIYHSTTINQMCAELGIQISFCQPFSPSTKGKCERLILTIKSAFYPEAQRAGFTKLDELNAFLFAWLSKEYHRRVHSALNSMTPLERWRKDINRIDRLTPEQIKRALMMRTTRRVHSRTGLISLESRTYQASPRLAGQTVEVRWHAGDEREVEIFAGGKMLEVAKLVAPSGNIDFSRKHQNKAKIDYLPLSSAKNYARKLMQSHQGETPLISMSKLSDEHLCQEELCSSGIYKGLFQKKKCRFLPATSYGAHP